MGGFKDNDWETCGRTFVGFKPATCPTCGGRYFRPQETDEPEAIKPASPAPMPAWSCVECGKPIPLGTKFNDSFLGPMHEPCAAELADAMYAMATAKPNGRGR